MRHAWRPRVGGRLRALVALTFGAVIITTMKPPDALSLTPDLSRLSSSRSTLPPQMSLSAETSQPRFCATSALKAATCGSARACGQEGRQVGEETAGASA